MGDVNIALKVAIVKSRKRHNEVARLARIHPARFSDLVRGVHPPNESEKLRIAGVLQCPVDELFPSDDSESVAS